MYQVALPKRVLKQQNKIPRQYNIKIDKILMELRTDPLLGKPLTGEFKGQYSVRAWPYRVIYQILKQEKIILITTIQHRQGAYK
jgi:addiction module RelE/StbE family toxin